MYWNLENVYRPVFTLPCLSSGSHKTKIRVGEARDQAT